MNSNITQHFSWKLDLHKQVYLKIFRKQLLLKIEENWNIVIVINISMLINVHLLVNGKISNSGTASSVSVISERNAKNASMARFAKSSHHLPGWTEERTPSLAKSLDRIINTSWKIGFRFRVRFYRETSLQWNHFRCSFEKIKRTTQN